ncbi:MAG: hypothetical protein U0694_25630 [Anaerolineae bacterium]
MLKRLYLLLMLILVCAACQPNTAQNANPTDIAFPTVTPGREVTGLLPVNGVRIDSSGIANPATVVALASQPTATPNYAACPVPGTPATAIPTPTTEREIASAISAYLAAGSDPAALGGVLNGWGIMGDTGFARVDVDMTGEGTPEIIAGFSAPDTGGTLLIYTCANGSYTLRYQDLVGGTVAPQMLFVGDMNANNLPEIAYTANVCDVEDTCLYNTQIITWNAPLGRFISLLEGTLSSDDVPTLTDVDSDRVAEIVVQLNNDGTAATGPLRTGTHIYDWNGTFYVLSIVQLDPPGYRIQVVQEADRAFARLDMSSALPLYQLALDDSQGLRYWYNDESTVLRAYIMYRELLAYAYTEDQQRLIVLQDISTLYPDANTAPVYVTLAQTFWNTLQVTNNLHNACVEVLNIVANRSDALDLLNRYGSRSPIYAAQTLCPF